MIGFFAWGEYSFVEPGTNESAYIAGEYESCPVCSKKGLESGVNYYGTMSTLMYCGGYDCNMHTSTYDCSKGHEWYTKRQDGVTTETITKDTETLPYSSAFETETATVTVTFHDDITTGVLWWYSYPPEMTLALGIPSSKYKNLELLDNDTGNILFAIDLQTTDSKLHIKHGEKTYTIPPSDREISRMFSEMADKIMEKYETPEQTERWDRNKEKTSEAH